MPWVTVPDIGLIRIQPAAKLVMVANVARSIEAIVSGYRVGVQYSAQAPDNLGRALMLTIMNTCLSVRDQRSHVHATSYTDAIVFTCIYIVCIIFVSTCILVH